MPDPTLDLDEAAAFLQRVYGNAPGLLAISHQNAAKRFQGDSGHHNNHRSLLAQVKHLDAAGARGIYLRTTTLATPPAPGSRGTAHDSYALPGLWADVDFGTDGHKPGPNALPLPPDADSARRIVTESGLPAPSLWVHSGGGLYPWWLLDEPLIIDDSNRAMSTDVSTAWQQALRRPAAHLGWEYGAGVGDLSRVLRLPGTLNRKTDTPRPCKVIQDTGQAYTFSELAYALTTLPVPEPTPAAPPRPQPRRDVVPLTPGTSAFDQLDAATTFDDILTGAGWTLHRGNHPGAVDQCWTRPGDPDNPCSAHTLTARPEVLVVHSELAGLPTGGGQKLTRGRVFSHLHHGGNESAAAADILAAIGGRPCTPAAAALPLPRSTPPVSAPTPTTHADLGTLGVRAVELEQERVAHEHQAERLRRSEAGGVNGGAAADDEAPNELDERSAFECDLASEAHRMRVRQAAQELVRAEKAKSTELPTFMRLDDFLARPLPPITHRVEKLWPAGGNVLLAAQWKAGKTTLRDNLVRSLVDGTPFLGRFSVDNATPCSVALIDFELDEQTLQRWLDDQDFANPERIQILSMRGRASTFNILDEHVRSRWAVMLRDLGVTQVVIDCLRPILDALSLSEDKEAGRFLEALDELAHQAGVREKFLVHHMGHSSERSRGDSRLLDWPDALWKLTRLKDDDDPTLDDPAGPRFFSAFGRDVNHPESELTFDPATRHLALGDGAVNRKAAGAVRKAHAARPAVLEAVRKTPGMGIRQIRHKCDGHGNPAIDAAVKQLIEEGVIEVVKSGQKHCHYDITVPTVPNGANDVPRHGGVNRARVPLSTDTHPEHPDTDHHLPGTGTVNPDQFEKPTGPSRCDICGYHTPTQGHSDGCPQRSAS